MTRIFLGLVCVGMTSACVPQGMTEQDLTNFDNALVSIGCDLKFESDYQPLEFQTGLSREDVQRAANAKIQRGQAVALEGGGVRSKVGTCGPQKDSKPAG